MPETNFNGFRELATQLGDGNRIYMDAYKDGITMSQKLERLDPSSQYVGDDAWLGQLDAFERQMFAAGIRAKSDPSKGIYADTVGSFFLQSDNHSNVLFPEFINRIARMEMQAPDILNEIVGQVTPITGNSYRTFYVDMVATGKQKRRASQTADLPVATITDSEKSITLNKRGIVVEATYEAIRRMRIDEFTLLVQGVLRQTNVDIADEAINVLLTGDGNDNTAATNYNLTDMGGVVEEGISWQAWLKYRAQFYPYTGNVSVCDLDQLLKVYAIQPPNVDPLMLLNQLNGGGSVNGSVQMAQNMFNTPMRYVYLPATALANKILTIDKKFALEQVTEIGADLAETEKLVRTQFEAIVLSQVLGFGVMFPRVVKTLTTNA